MRNAVIFGVILLIGFAYYVSRKETVPPAELPATETKVPQETLILSSPVVETDSPIEIEDSPDETDVSTQLLETLKAEDSSDAEKIESLETAIAQLPKAQAITLLETVVLTNENPALLKASIQKLRERETPQNLKDFHQRLQVHSFQEEKWKAIDEAMEEGASEDGQF